MILTYKVRLVPNSEQEQKLWQSANIARWAYNWALGKQIEHFTETGKLTKIPDTTLRKELTQLKQTAEYSWLYEVSNNITKQAIKDLCQALDTFHKRSKKTGHKHRKSAIKRQKPLTAKDLENFPRFKSKRKTKPSFYNDNIKLKVKPMLVLIEKVGWVKTSEQIPINTTYINPRISFDGKYWYISVGVEQEKPNIELTEEILGIDVGVKDLAICSNGTKYKNINKTKKVKKLEKRLRRLQRKVSNKYQKNKKGRKFVKTSNIIKLEQNIRLLHRRLSNIRNNHIHQATTEIVKTKPSRIVIEDLNIRGMMKNHHLSKAIQKQCLHRFISILEYKSDYYGIELVKADRFFPSSKLCSKCGNKKAKLPLSVRVYTCKECGLKIDRDMNAAINLSRYVA